MKKSSSIIFLFLFMSGWAGLQYQIVWVRLLHQFFGSSTPSVVAVSSAFMAGLAFGSFLAGLFLKKHRTTLLVYSLIELLIGITGLILPNLLPGVSNLVYLTRDLFHISDILLKFISVFIVLLIPTSLMGMTIPIIVDWLQGNTINKISLQVSRVYAINTFGAVVGTIFSAFVLIELLGLSDTNRFAVMINLTISGAALLLSRVYVDHEQTKETKIPDEKTYALNPLGKIALIIFIFSGLISLSYEIIWTRLLTPSLGSYVYAYASILVLVLLGLTLGSYFFSIINKRLDKPILSLGMAQAMIGFGAVLSIFSLSRFLILPSWLLACLTILPATIAMGMTFPIVSKLAPNTKSASQFVAFAYSFNTIGCGFGPLIAAYLLLPALGSSRSLLLLSGLNFLFSLILISLNEKLRFIPKRLSLFPVTGLIILIFLVFWGRGVLIEKKLWQTLDKITTDKNYTFSYKEDETAAVLAYYNPLNHDNNLLVDGVGMTGLLDETKLMAHLPILIHEDPKSMLVICLGMGTTYRSALTYDISIDAVEIVPSVPKMLPVFWKDSDILLKNPKGKIIIDDGRNYVKYTDKKYDIVQIDPPPPVNSAGTTTLYSKEFYEDIKRKLNDRGIVFQWFFRGTDPMDFMMLVNTFRVSFPYVAYFGSPNGIGLFAVGSNSPIVFDKAVAGKRLEDNPRALTDLNEWNKWDLSGLMKLYVKDPAQINDSVKDKPIITDNYPRTEYFLLRHYFSQ